MSTKVTKTELLSSLKRLREVKAIVQSKESGAIVESKLREIGVELFAPKLPYISK